MDVLTRVRRENRKILLEDEAKELLCAFGVPVNPARVCKSAQEAVMAAREFGFPVALKIRSVLAVHKSEIGGVHLNIKSDEEVRRSFLTLLSLAAADPGAAVTVQPMAEPGAEFIIGTYCDPNFGQVIAFGPGGILAELYGDVTFRLLPLDEKTALDMMRSIRGHKLVAGFRHFGPVDRDALAAMMLSVSGLTQKIPEVVEMDLNPVVAYPGGAVVLDARICLKEEN